MVAEKVSVLPSKTVPELGATVTVICGVGGVVELPPGPLAQAVREIAKTRRKIVHAGWRRMRGLQVEGPCVERFCERGRMVFAIADEGPAKEWVPRKPWPSVRGEFISFKVRGTKSLELVSWDARLGKSACGCVPKSCGMFRIERGCQGAFPKREWRLGSIDFRWGGSNNRAMTKPEAVRRIKSYSAANGYVYQYYFCELNRVSVEGRAAGEFVYAISADRGISFGLRIFMMQAALKAWARANGRALTGNEEYAVAKMRLFQAFDEGVVPVTAEEAREVRLVVDESNLEELLKMLNI